MLCLKIRTRKEWAALAVSHFDRVLVDHAHCEMKAASSALSLAPRFTHAPQLVRPLIAIAQEELGHFEQVLEQLERRSLALGPPPVDDYVADLRRRVLRTSSGISADHLVDRLLIGALIEARSCERFQLLGEELEQRGMKQESTFYRGLMESEARHYRTFRDLAVSASDKDCTVIDARLTEIAMIESEIAEQLGTQAAIHG